MTTMYDGTSIPDTLLIGVERSRWPVQIFQGGVPQEQAANWLAEGLPEERTNKRVYLVTLTPVEQMVYVPPVPARVEGIPAKVFPVQPK